MQDMNILRFDFDTLIDSTKPTSSAYGRRLYQVQHQGQWFWLKAQLRDTHIQFERSYCQELGFYQHMQGQYAYLLPFQQLDASNQVVFERSYDVLILPHAEPWLSDPKQLSVHHIAKKIIAMLQAIEDLYALGYLHADLKHEHFIDWQGQLKLIDFEQVQSIDSKLNHVTATPRYMAPELFHGEAKSLHSELYALGIIIYEWLKEERLVAKRYIDWAYLHCQNLTLTLPEPYAVFLPLLQSLTMKQKAARQTDISEIKQQLLQIDLKNS